MIFCAPFLPSVRCLRHSTAGSHGRGSVIGPPALPPDLCKLLPLSLVVLFLSAKGQREERSQVCLDLVPSHLPHVRGDEAFPFPMPRFPQREGRMGWEYTARAQCTSPGGAVSQAEPKTDRGKPRTASVSFYTPEVTWELLGPYLSLLPSPS